MKIAFYSRNEGFGSEPRLAAMVSKLREASFGLYRIRQAEDLQPDTGMLVSVGGDGTFLSASKRVGDSGVPILGVNQGRLGFLSEYGPEEALEALLTEKYSIEDRALLKTSIIAGTASCLTSFWPYTLNEISVHRFGPAILGVDVTVDGLPLPTYWGDGLLVATSSGSTAYSLSVGGPICSPASKVLIIAPIAPHNLNVRPLVVPDSTAITIALRSRDERVALSMDNRNIEVSPDTVLSVGVAQFSLKRVCLEKSSFVKALKTKLFWGEDIRNGTDL